MSKKLYNCIVVGGSLARRAYMSRLVLLKKNRIYDVPMTSMMNNRKTKKKVPTSIKVGSHKVPTFMSPSPKKYFLYLLVGFAGEVH